MTKENGHSSTLNAVRHPDAIEDRDRLLGRSARFHRDEKGQVMVMTALLALVFVLFWSTLFGVGEALGMKMKLQDVADTQVYTEALWGARTMNWIAYVNKAQVANLIIITQFSIIHSHAKFWFDVSAFLFLIFSILAKIPYIGPIFNVLNNTLFAVGAGVVAAYELFAYYLADYGIPAVALMIQALCYWQYAWMGFVIFFPERGDEVMRRVLEGVKPAGVSGDDVYDENKLGGLSQFGSLATNGGGSSANAATDFVSATGKAALKIYSYYKYYALLKPTEGPTGIDETSRFTLPESESEIPMWKRVKWMTENTANQGGEYTSGTGKDANDPFFHSWRGRNVGGDFNVKMKLSIGVIGVGFEMGAGGDTHVFRWSGDEPDNGNHKMEGNRIKLRSGLWQWHKASNESYDGWKKWDSFAHDYFFFKIFVELFWNEFTLLEIGLHEVELTSEDIGSDGTKNDSDGSNPVGDSAAKAEAEAEKARQAGIAADKIIAAYGQWESEATTKANEKDPDTDEYLHGDATARAAYRDSILASQDTNDYDYKLYRNGGSESGATGLGNLSDYNKLSDGAPSPSSYSEWDGLSSYSAWRWGSANDAKAWAEKVKETAQTAEDSANEMRESADEISDLLDEAVDSITGALYGDRPVLIWWEVFWQTDSGKVVKSLKRDDTEAKVRWSKDGTGDGQGDRQAMTWWELDSSVESDTAKRHAYVWTTDARKITHMTYLTMPYEFGLRNFGLGQWMFSAQDDSGRYRMFDGRGFGVLARAECVYINSANRSQWPNVFNPYWRPRLAPIAYELTELLEKIPIFNSVTDESSGFGATFNSLMRSLFPH